MTAPRGYGGALGKVWPEWASSPKGVIVGSYNRTEAGACDNDENTLILHDRELARAYDAEWQRLWATVPEERVCNGFEVCLPVVMSGCTVPYIGDNSEPEATTKQETTCD